jgi:hypothetical protein
MKDIINLLIEKNECLEKFFTINSEQLDFIVKGNYDGLDSFYKAREGLLEIIERVDELVEKEASEVVPGSTTVEDRMKMEEVLNIKNDWVTKILDQDLAILTAIDQAKSNVIKELTQVKSARKAVGAYKSGAKDSIFDEEA